MLTSAALVLMMTGPGLALFYGGLVRRKNVLGTMMHSFFMMGLVTVIWAVALFAKSMVALTLALSLSTSTEWCALSLFQRKRPGVDVLVKGG